MREAKHSLKTTESIDDAELFYDLLTMNIISFSLTGPNEEHNRMNVAPGV